MSDFGSVRSRKKADSAEDEKQTHFNCDGCHADLRYPNRKEGPPAGNHIVGRTRGGGYLCQLCYERGESFDYRDKAFVDFHERHKSDEWGALIKATYQLHGAPREDFRDVLGILKALSRGGAFGELPYDPSVREPA